MGCYPTENLPVLGEKKARESKWRVAGDKEKESTVNR
jgi:hypothetical protein